MLEAGQLQSDGSVKIVPIDEIQSGNTLHKIAYDEFRSYRVSTIFLSVDHGFGDTKLWFETMVFQGSWTDILCKRYTTYEEAMKGHAEICKRYGGPSLWFRAIRAIDDFFNGPSTFRLS